MRASLRRAARLAMAVASVVAGVGALATWPAPAAADELKVVQRARKGPFESLDPVKQFGDVTSPLVEMLYSKLLAYAYLERPYKLVPDLLTRMPELGPDQLTYTFTLRSGVRFHDNACFPGGKGRELTTDDVFYSLRRYADGRLNHKSWFAMEGAVVGLDAFRAATLQAGPGADTSRLPVEGFKKLDDHRFTIKLTHENPLFLFALAISPTGITPVEAVQTYQDQFGVNPVGTGPFSLQGAERKGVLRFVKHRSYHGVYPSVGAPGDAERGLLKDAGKRLPLVDVVEMPLIEESQPEALKFLNGELDWREMDRASFTKLIVRDADGTLRLKDEFAAKFRLFSTLGVDSIFFNLNLKDPLLGPNKALRQALVHLVDVRGIVDLLLNGRGRKLQGLLPYEMPGGERETGAVGREYDLEAANRLLAEAGYPGGKGLPPLTVAFTNAVVDGRTMFDFMKARFAAAGVQVKPNFLDGPAFAKSVEGSNFQIAYGGWYADYVDAENFYQLLYSKNTAPGPNASAFANAAYDRAYEASRFMANGPARYAHFKTMNDILRDQAPVIQGWNPMRLGVTQKWLANFKRNPLTPEYAFVDIDMAQKKKGL